MCRKKQKSWKHFLYLDNGGGRGHSDGHRVDTDGDGSEHDEDLLIFRGWCGVRGREYAIRFR